VQWDGDKFDKCNKGEGGFIYNGFFPIFIQNIFKTFYFNSCLIIKIFKQILNIQ
jgi:hypothetical protein